MKCYFYKTWKDVGIWMINVPQRLKDFNREWHFLKGLRGLVWLEEVCLLGWGGVGFEVSESPFRVQSLDLIYYRSFWEPRNLILPISATLLSIQGSSCLLALLELLWEKQLFKVGGNNAQASNRSIGWKGVKFGWLYTAWQCHLLFTTVRLEHIWNLRVSWNVYKGQVHGEKYREKVF